MFPALLPTYNRTDIAFVRGEGSYLFAEDGKRYLDFGAGIAVNAFGHANPKLVAALTEQAGKLWHTSNLYRVPGQESLSKKLVANTFADTVFFTNSGAEAVECAIKTARRYHYAQGQAHRHKLISFDNAFHGRTLGAISATSQPKMRDGFEPLLPGFQVVPFNDLDAALAAIDDNTAGFLLEPVQGEGGVTPATAEFLTGLRKACDEQGLLLILDEVQCGYARTGTFFAHEQYGVKPDIMAVAKGIGAGFPLGACLATEEAAKGMVFGTHGSTYGGNPLAMAVGIAVLEEVLADGFLEQVTAMGARLRSALEQMIPNHDDMFEDVRGMGLMLGVKMKDAYDARAFVGHLRDHHGLLAVSAGQNVLRILPPLVIEESHIAEAIEKISAGARSFAEAKAA